MPNDNEKAAPVDYRSMIAPQDEVVEKLSKEYENSPSDEVRAKLERETDLLRYYINSAKGDPRSRARSAAEKAKQSVLGKAVTQPLK